jgi:hypothetical protein
VTVRLTLRVFAAGAPGVFAEMVIGVVASGVEAVAVNVNITVAGKADTAADGEKLHVTPAGIPLPGHANVTVPEKAPAPLTTNAIPCDVLPCCTVTLAGDGAPKAKSTTCSVTAASCVVVDASVPTACTLNR